MDEARAPGAQGRMREREMEDGKSWRSFAVEEETLRTFRGEEQRVQRLDIGRRRHARNERRKRG